MQGKRWLFELLLFSILLIGMSLPYQWTPSCLLPFSFFELLPWDKFKTLSPPFLQLSGSKEQVAVNPTAAEAQDQVVAAALLGAACRGRPTAAHSRGGPCASDDLIRKDGFSAARPGGVAVAGLISWDCYLILRGRKTDTNTAGRLAQYSFENSPEKSQGALVLHLRGVRGSRVLGLGPWPWPWNPLHGRKCANECGERE